eukprot:gene18351-13191_t
MSPRGLVDHNHNSLEILSEAKAILDSGDVYTWASQGNAVPLELLWDLHCLSALKGVGERYTYQMEAWQSPETWSSPLQFAVNIGRISVVQVFTACPRLLINHQTRYGDSALHFACYFGQHEIVEILLAHPEIDVNLVNK